MMHTQGNWELAGTTPERRNNKNEFLVISKKYCIAKIPHQNSANIVCASEQEAEANAKLIAAAPEMLEAIELALMDFENEGIELNHDTVTALRNAIKKATS